MTSPAGHPPPTSAVRPYFPELDGVRGFAVFMVMAFHFSQALYPRRFLMVGQTGVELFFVLSGFLISTLLLQSTHGDWHEMRNFYIRRALRIFPLYYGYLFFVAYLTGISGWFWVYLQNFPMAFNVPPAIGTPHLWSLAVEEQFYLVWPFLILFWPRRWLAHAMGSVLALSVVLRVLLAFTSVNAFYFTFTRLDGLAAGSLLALGWHRGVLGKRRGLLGGGTVLFCVLLLVGARISGGHGLAWVQVTKYLAAAGTYSCAVGLLLVTSGTALHRVLRSRPMRAVGRVSYGMYVFHPYILYGIVTRLPAMPLAVRAALFLVTSYLLAVVSYYGFEKRFIDLKQKLAPEKRFRTVVGGQEPLTSVFSGQPEAVSAQDLVKSGRG